MAKTPEERKAYNRAYYLATKERAKQRNAEYRAENREHVLAQKKEYYQKVQKEKMTPEYRRAAHLKNTYGITPEKYDELMELQGGRCATCGTDQPGNGWKNFPIDHNHTTDEVRGLLCGRCNMAIGLVDDNPDVLVSMAAYLMQSVDIFTMSDFERICRNGEINSK